LAPDQVGAVSWDWRCVERREVGRCSDWLTGSVTGVDVVVFWVAVVAVAKGLVVVGRLQSRPVAAAAAVVVAVVVVAAGVDDEKNQWS
jgi:hypothetical protein